MPSTKLQLSNQTPQHGNLKMPLFFPWGVLVESRSAVSTCGPMGSMLWQRWRPACETRASTAAWLPRKATRHVTRRLLCSASRSRAKFQHSMHHVTLQLRPSTVTVSVALKTSCLINSSNLKNYEKCRLVKVKTSWIQSKVKGKFIIYK